MRKKGWFYIMMSLILVFSQIGCGKKGTDKENKLTEQIQELSTTDEAEPIEIESEEDIQATEEAEIEEPETWLIMWYLCGSNLESDLGCASEDLFELTDIVLPENVTVLIETGGARQWMNEFVDGSKIQRWMYQKDELTLVDEQPSSNMGAAHTLSDFLFYAEQNYDADHRAVFFWNHGGGSLNGAAFDELYNNDSIDLLELYSALDSVYQLDMENPPIDVFGFDTCLMATVDVASTLQGFSHYLVASEETEPGNGWYYTGLANAFAKNPYLTAEEFGIAICDSFYQGCEMVGTESNITLSVTDLTKISGLVDAYEAFGQECLVAASMNPGFLAEFARAASNSENYGGNTREEGYSDMVDLGHLARNTLEVLPSAQEVLDELDKCIVYKVNGEYRSEATGLSCYYSYDSNIDAWSAFDKVGAGLAFKHLFFYALTGELDDSTIEYLESLDIEYMPGFTTIENSDWEEFPLGVNDEGYAYLYLGEAAADILADIRFSLFYFNAEEDYMLFLGTDNDIYCDWENGVFFDNFRGVWGSINGFPVYMELTCSDTDYNLYSVPILLNYEPYNLQVVYRFDTQEWVILGASEGIDENGMASKKLIFPEEGDVITVLWQMASYEGEEDFEMYEVEDIIVDEYLFFDEAELPDGEYGMVFTFSDIQGNMGMSEAAFFTCEDGVIYTSLDD